MRSSFAVDADDMLSRYSLIASLQLIALSSSRCSGAGSLFSCALRELSKRAFFVVPSMLRSVVVVFALGAHVCDLRDEVGHLLILGVHPAQHRCELVVFLLASSAIC